MKKRIIRWYDKLIVALLGLFPFLSGCIEEAREEYGCPNADYVVKGTVTDSTTGNPVQNIRVTLQQGQEPYVSPDTVLTGADGNYQFEFNTFPYNEATFGIQAEDIDGTAGGGEYLTATGQAKVEDAVWNRKDAGDWYSGTATMTKDIRLKK